MRRVSEWANKSHPRTKSATSEQIAKAKVKAKNVHRTKNGIRFWYIMWINEFYCITMTRLENFRWSLYSIHTTMYMHIDTLHLDRCCLYRQQLLPFKWNDTIWSSCKFHQSEELDFHCIMPNSSVNSQLTNRGYKTNNIPKQNWEKQEMIRRNMQTSTHSMSQYSLCVIKLPTLNHSQSKFVHVMLCIAIFSAVC